jgi:hypothetical protein
MNALDFIREKEQEVENLFKDWHIEKLASEIEEFAEKYHQAKLKLLGIGDGSNCDAIFEEVSKFSDEDIECDATEADIY